MSALYFLRSTRSYPFYPFSPPLPALPFNLSVFYFFFPVHLTRRQGGRRGEEEYFTRLILRGTGAITVAINDNVKTFYRDFSTLSRLTAQGKYREPRFEPHYLGVREFRTDIDTGEARRGEARKFPQRRNGFARCVYLSECICDISIGHDAARSFAISRVAAPPFHQSAQMIMTIKRLSLGGWASLLIQLEFVRVDFIFFLFFDNISRKMEVSSLISRARTNGKFLFKNNLAGRSWKFHVSLSLSFFLCREETIQTIFI